MAAPGRGLQRFPVPLWSNSCQVNSPPDSASTAQSEKYVELVLSGLCAGSFADHGLVSFYPSNEHGDALMNSLRSADLEVICKLRISDMPKGSETASSAYSHGNFSREATPVSELRAHSAEMETLGKTSAPKPKRKSPVVKIPSTAEIAEFFSAAEQRQQQRFAEKYNYDIVKDAPMEGRYQWVPLEQ